MYDEYDTPDYYSLRQTDETYKAFVDAIIPRTPELAVEFGRIQYYGALDLDTDEYMIMSLNNIYFPIAEAAAELLNMAAEQFTLGERNSFAELLPLERLQVLNLLVEPEVRDMDFPEVFRDDPDSRLNVMSIMNRFAMMGYYSEWSGYGSTRLEPPDQRVLEYFPLSWEQVGYPGPSPGYRALRADSFANGSA